MKFPGAGQLARRHERANEPGTGAGDNQWRGAMVQGEALARSIGSGRAASIAGLVSEVQSLVDLELRVRLLEVIKDVETDIVSRLRICRRCGTVFLCGKRGGQAKRCESCRKGGRHV